MINKDSNSAGQPPSFNLSMFARRPSHIMSASSEVQTESTAQDSMFSGSLVGSLGKGSFVDFSMSIGRRTSIAKNLAHRRRTEIVEDVRRESDGTASLNDRGSVILEQQEEEGNVNLIRSIKAGGMCFSDVNVTIEECKENMNKSAPGFLDSHRSGSGSGRLHNVIGSFVDPADNDQEDPFATDNQAAATSEQLKEYDDDCDAVDTEEHQSKQIPFESSHAAIYNRNPETFGRSHK